MLGHRNLKRFCRDGFSFRFVSYRTASWRCYDLGGYRSRRHRFGRKRPEVHPIVNQDYRMKELKGDALGNAEEGICSGHEVEESLCGEIRNVAPWPLTGMSSVRS